jgi:hypothetical protein
MNTIIVMFEGTCKKKYAYNTDSKVAIGDVLVSPGYSNSKMTVIDVLDESYKYVNPDTGELSNKMTSLNQNLIKTLKVAADKVDQTILCIRLTK